MRKSPFRRPSHREVVFVHTRHRRCFGAWLYVSESGEYRTRNRRMMKGSLRCSIFLVRHSAVHRGLQTQSLRCFYSGCPRMGFRKEVYGSKHMSPPFSDHSQGLEFSSVGSAVTRSVSPLTPCTRTGPPLSTDELPSITSAFQSSPPMRT